MSRQLTVTVTLSGTCPEKWDWMTKETIKERSEEVSEDAARRLFRELDGLIVASTATVEGGGHE